MDIFAPVSLNTANAVLNLAESFGRILDPTERKKISNDVVAFHALNDAEAKKSADAKALIKQHTDILEETKRIAAQNKKDTAELDQQKVGFKAESEAERLKISEEWSNVKVASEAAKALHDKAASIINDVAKREDDLRQQKEEHAINVKKLKDGQDSLKKEYEKVEEIKRQHTELLESIKTKQAAIAAFNI